MSRRSLPTSSVSRDGEWEGRPGLRLLTPPTLPSRYDEGSGGSGDEGRDEAHKREWHLFYQKQMRLRKVMGAGPASSQHLPSARVPASGQGASASGQGASWLSCHLAGQGSQAGRICAPRSVQKLLLGMIEVIWGLGDPREQEV